MRRPLAGLLLALLLPSTTRGADEPLAGGRIRHVDYDPDEVVTIEGTIGVAVHIQLEPGEAYVAHAFGDGKAWDFAYRQHHLFVKPTAVDADTNLTVVTDRRSYHFALRLRMERGTVPTYEVAFRYRDRRSRAAQQAALGEKLEEAFARPPRQVNLRYTMSGDTDIAPVNCWDDRLMTSFKFAGGADLPAIYMVDPDGRESVVDRHSAGPSNEIVVVHRVAARWVLRLGGRALAVWNDAYSPEGRTDGTGTSVPDARRVLWR